MLNKTRLLVGVYLCKAGSSALVAEEVPAPPLLPLSSFCLNITEKLLPSWGEPFGSLLQVAAEEALRREEFERCMLLRGSTKSTKAGRNKIYEYGKCPLNFTLTPLTAITRGQYHGSTDRRTTIG